MNKKNLQTNIFQHNRKINSTYKNGKKFLAKNEKAVKQKVIETLGFCLFSFSAMHKILTILWINTRVNISAWITKKMCKRIFVKCNITRKTLFFKEC